MDPCSIIKYLLPHLSGLDWRRAAQLHTHDPAPGPALQAGDPSLSAPPHLSSSCPAGAWQLAGGRGGWSQRCCGGGAAEFGGLVWIEEAKPFFSMGAWITTSGVRGRSVKMHSTMYCSGSLLKIISSFICKIVHFVLYYSRCTL